MSYYFYSIAGLIVAFWPIDIPTAEAWDLVRNLQNEENQ